MAKASKSAKGAIAEKKKAKAAAEQVCRGNATGMHGMQQWAFC
jgi:hypothetical protein